MPPRAPLPMKLAGLAAAMLLAAACSSSRAATTTPTGPTGGTITQRLVAQWLTLDPQVQQTTDSYQTFSGAYDWLVALKGGKVYPYLATSWKQSPTSIKFTLRKDATCSDGTPVTATVVANSFKRLLITNVAVNPSIKSQFGPPPYTIDADDSAATVTISIGRPFSGLLYAFSTASQNAAIVCPKGIGNPSELARSMDGSGPFTLQSLTADTATLVARSDWRWGPLGLTTKSPGFPQTMVYKVVANETTAANLLETGGVDIAVITGPDNTRLIADRSLIHKAGHSYSTDVVIFNEAAGRPAANVAVRKALSASIDPKAFDQAGWGGLATPSTSLITPDTTCFDPATKSLVPTPSIANAKQIMSSAGYTVGSDGTWQDASKKQVLITVAGGQNQGSSPEYLAAQFTSAGFAVKLNKGDRATYAKDYLSGNFDVAISESAAAVPDPNLGNLALTTGAVPPNGSNATRMDYPDIDAEVAAANATQGAESCKHWANVQELLLKNFILVPTAAPQYQWYSRGIDYPAEPRTISPMFLKRVK